jgi:hypothetical protein
LLTTLFLKKAGEAAGEQRGVIKTDLILKGKGKIPNLSPFPLPLIPRGGPPSTFPDFCKRSYTPGNKL